MPRTGHWTLGTRRTVGVLTAGFAGLVLATSSLVAPRVSARHPEMLHPETAGRTFHPQDAALESSPAY